MRCIEKWIEEQLKGCSVTVVLFGAETYNRPWLEHEIKRSHQLKMGILAIDIHNARDPLRGTDVQGRNPLEHWSDNGRPFTSLIRLTTGLLMTATKVGWSTLPKMPIARVNR